MIKRTRDYNTPPSELVTPDALSELKSIALNADKDRIKASIYKGGESRAVREKLKEIYKNKCAYCESHDASPDVEHYRPKKGVTGLRPHLGYYWLCYEWSNLLPSCRFCNTGSGKGNHFPLMPTGMRVNTPTINSGDLDLTKNQIDQSPLIDEHPYLLHPEVDSNFENFLKFSRNGSVEGIDAAQRGKKTIEICDLDRENLRVGRQKIINDFKERLEDALILFIGNVIDEATFKFALKRIFERLESRDHPDKEYSLMAKQCFNDFENLLLPELSAGKQQDAVRDAYRQYRRGEL